jgi:hypothetical protein
MQRLLHIIIWLVAPLIGLWVIGWRSPARTWGSTVTVTDGCNDAAGGSRDILSFTATLDSHHWAICHRLWAWHNRSQPSPQIRWDIHAHG